MLKQTTKWDGVATAALAAAILVLTSASPQAATNIGPGTVVNVDLDNGSSPLGPIPGSPMPDVTLDGGSLKNSNSHAVINVNRIFTITGNDGYLTAGWSKSLTINGPITGSAGGSLIMNNDSGVVILNNTVNSYDGNTIIGATGPGASGGNGPRLRLGNSEVLPNTTNVSFANNGSLDLNGKTETIANMTASGTGFGGSGAITNSSGTTATLNATGAITNNGFSVGGTGAIEINGSISGPGVLTKANGNTVTLNGPLTYTGKTTVDGGLLKLVNTKPNSSNFTSNANLEFNITTGQQQFNGGTFDGTGNLIKTGGGRMLLGANGSPQTIAFSGANSVIDVQAGLLRNEYGNSAWGSNKAGLTVGATGTFDLWDGSATVDELNGSGIINKGWNPSRTLTVGINNGTGGDFSGTIYNNESLGYNHNAGGNLSLVKTGTGIQTLSGTSNTYAGGTTIENGFLRVSADGSLGATSGAVTIRDGGVLQNNNSNVALDANRTIILANGEGRIRSGWTNRTITVNGQVTGPGDLRIVNDSSLVVLANTTINENNYTGDTIIGGDTSNGGTGTLARLTLGASQVIPNGAGNGNVIFDAGTGGTGILNLNGFDESINGLTVASGSGIVENTKPGTTATLRVGRGAATSTFAGILRDNGGVLAVEKVNAGIFTPTGNNTYTGGTTIAGGEFRVTTDANLGAVSGSPTVNITLNGGTLKNNDSNTTIGANRTIELVGDGYLTAGWSKRSSIAGQVTGSGNLVINNDSGFIFLDNAANDYTGSTTIGATGPGASGANGPRLILGNSEVLPDGTTVSINNNGSLDLNGKTETVANSTAAGTGFGSNGAITNSSATVGTLNVTGEISNNGFSIGGNGDITINGSINGNNRLTKVNGNTVSLGGTADNVSLQGTVDGGVLELTKSSTGSVHALGGGTHIVNNGGTLRLAGTGNDQIFNGSTLTVNSGGVLDLNGRNETVNTMNIAGTGAGSGAITNSSATASTLTGTITNTDFTVGGTGDITLNGVVGNAAATNTLTKIDGNTLTLGGAGDNARLLLDVQAGRVHLDKASNGNDHAVGGIGDIATGAVVQLTGTGGDQIFNGSANTTFGGVNMSGGILALGGNSETVAELNGTGIVQDFSGTPILTIGNFNRSSQFDGIVRGTLGLAKIGNGTFTLTNDNNAYAGDTNVNGGFLLVDGTHTGAGDYTVASGATLGGNGTINLASGQTVDISNNPGIVSPGNAPSGYSGPDPTYSAGADIATVGTLSINASDPGALALSMGGTLQIDLLSPLVHDLLDITGTVDIGGVNPTTLEVNGETDLSLLDFGGLGFMLGDRVDFLLADEILGDFDSFPSNTHFYDAGGQQIVLGNDGTALFLQVVPEPSSLLIWTAIALGLAAFTWRRRM